MPKPIAGLHHVTAIASDPRRNLAFYTRVMGLRLIKRTINFDDPATWHFYFGDDAGTPGTILSFFSSPFAGRGSPGTGEVYATALRLPLESLSFWEKRLAEAGIRATRTARFQEEVIHFTDPDGMRLELTGQRNVGSANASRSSDVPREHAIRGLAGITLCEGQRNDTRLVLEKMGFTINGEEGPRQRFVLEGPEAANFIDVLTAPGTTLLDHRGEGQFGAGSVHHLAFRTADEGAQTDWRTVLIAASQDVTPALDRIYFRSIYFREPGGVLFELATDGPGFDVDEPLDSLGTSLKLPPWMEPQRARVERLLPDIRETGHKQNFDSGRIDPHRDQPVRHSGAALANASLVVILLHGRGASAEDILNLTDGLADERIAFLAPEASGHRWYPYSFLAPAAENEPWLSSALEKVGATVRLALNAGISRERIALCGFSQGACLATEFIARYPARYAALLAFTGGLIGPLDMNLHHQGDLAGMPAWFSSGDPDPHVPWDRVLASAEEFQTLGAEVHLRRFPDRPHTVLPEELQSAREWIFGRLTS